jgi:hypothetical protein
MTVQTERRTSLRKRPLSLVYVELGASNGGMMKDLGEEGFALRAMMPLRPDVNTVFNFSLDESTRIEGHAFVEWVEEDGRVAGLKFVNLPASDRQKLQQWLQGPQDTPRREADLPKSKPAPNSSKAELREEIRTPARNVFLPRATAPRTSVPAPAGPPESQQIPGAPPVSVPHTPVPVVVAVPEPRPVLAQPQASFPAVDPARTLPEPVIEPIASRILPAAPAPLATGLPEIAPHSIRPATPDPDVAPEPVTPLPGTDWLRGGSALEPLPTLEEDRDPNRASWMDHFTLARTFGLLLVVGLVAGSYIFHRELGQALIWLGTQISGAPEDQQTPASGPDGASPTSSSPEDSRSSPSAAAPSEPEPRSSAADRLKNPSAASSGSTAATESTLSENPPASEKPPLAQTRSSNPGTLVPAMQVNRAAPLPAPSDTGQQEFQQAQEILGSKSRDAEVPEAVRLLWVAVEKSNVAAELELAELYRTGRGVARNCDQARVLLTAAARKGNTQAQRNLEELPRQGCAE